MGANPGTLPCTQTRSHREDLDSALAIRGVLKKSETWSGAGRNRCRISSHVTFLVAQQWEWGVCVELSKGNARHTREGGEGTAPVRHLQGGLTGLQGSHSIIPQWGRPEMPAQPCSQGSRMGGVPSHTWKMGTLRAAFTFGDKNTYSFIFMYIHLYPKDISPSAADRAPVSTSN